MSNVLSDKPHAIGKLCRVRARVLTPGILITFVNLKEPVSQRLQMAGEPIGIGQSLPLIDSTVKCCPAPPPDRSLYRYTGVVQKLNSFAILEQLIVVIPSSGKHQSLRNHACARFQRKAQFDLVLGQRVPESEVLLDFGSSCGLSRE